MFSLFWHIRTIQTTTKINQITCLFSLTAMEDKLRSETEQKTTYLTSLEGWKQQVFYGYVSRLRTRSHVWKSCQQDQHFTPFPTALSNTSNDKQISKGKTDYATLLIMSSQPQHVLLICFWRHTRRRKTTKYLYLHVRNVPTRNVWNEIYQRDGVKSAQSRWFWMNGQSEV